MKNLKQLSRNELKNLNGGIGGPYTQFASFTDDPVTCHVHYTENASGVRTITHWGTGGCHNRQDGTKCESYTAMGGSCNIN